VLWPVTVIRNPNGTRAILKVGMVFDGICGSERISGRVPLGQPCWQPQIIAVNVFRRPSREDHLRIGGRERSTYSGFVKRIFLALLCRKNL